MDYNTTAPPLPPPMSEKELLDLTYRRLEVEAKAREAEARKRQYEQEEQKRELENQKLILEIETLRKNMERKASASNISSTICTHIIDNEKTVIGSEPVLKNIWTDDELALLKKKLLDATDQYSSW